MQLFNLGPVHGLDSQLTYHSLAHLGREALVITGPVEPHLCIGYHQDLDQDVDLDACERLGLPVFRREVGGGATYLDSGQMFFQVILRRDNPLARGTPADLFARLLQPPVKAFGDLGVDAVHRPVNDIVVRASGRKISGNGAGEVAGMAVLVGGMLNRFDYDAMVSVLRVPSEKFRDKVHKTMRENLTTIEEELGAPVEPEAMQEALVARFSELFGEMEEATTIDGEMRREMDSLAVEYGKEGWLRRRGRRSATRRIKVREGLEMLSGAWKAPGGLVRADAALREGALDGVELTGDFFIFPHDALEELEGALAGVAAERGAIEAAAAGVLSRPDVEALGLEPSDLANAILGPPREP